MLLQRHFQRNVAVDIGNTRLKCGILSPNGEGEVNFVPLPPKGERLSECALRQLFWWESLSDADVLTEDVYPEPLTWRIAQTGSFTWQELKAEVLKVRPRDKFKVVTRQHVPLKIDVDSPQKVGIDRLLAAFAAVKKYGDVPMLIVDAGSALTVDVVQDQTFCGGALLPGLVAQSESYPKISAKLPTVSIPDPFLTTRPVYPGRNTQDAIHNGLYWGTTGAIRQFYAMFFSNNSKKRTALLILTGGDADYLRPGLTQVIPFRRIKHHDALVLEGINLCAQ